MFCCADGQDASLKYISGLDFATKQALLPGLKYSGALKAFLSWWKHQNFDMGNSLLPVNNNCSSGYI